jgi:hypothetical protein
VKYSRFENFKGNSEVVPVPALDKTLEPLSGKKGIYALFAVLGITAYLWMRK